ncbi:MAG: ATP phosphoribosyltransferase regulatory subunit, partial [Gammaproteobacteria bacterium]
GYDLVVPPLVEYLESLLTGTGHDMDIATVKFVDQMGGRLLGIRADMTPQAARIDAHQLKRDHPVRLCYLGPVLRSVPEQQGAARNPLQVGAEIYGHQGGSSDVEIVSLMLETLKAVGVEDVYIDLGHTGVFRGLARHAGMSEADEEAFFDMLQRKAVPEIEAFLDGSAYDAATQSMLAALCRLNGDAPVLEEADSVFASAPAEVRDAIERLKTLSQEISAALPDVPLHFDMAELRGYQYHTGVVFAAYVPGFGGAVARGGRYDSVGLEFGRARPATGFSADIKTLLSLGCYQAPEAAQAVILAPVAGDAGLREAVALLREGGRRVIHALDAGDLEPMARTMGCGEVLVLRDGHWSTQQV